MAKESFDEKARKKYGKGSKNMSVAAFLADDDDDESIVEKVAEKKLQGTPQKKKTPVQEKTDLPMDGDENDTPKNQVSSPENQSGKDIQENSVNTELHNSSIDELEESTIEDEEEAEEDESDDSQEVVRTNFDFTRELTDELAMFCIRSRENVKVRVLRALLWDFLSMPPEKQLKKYKSLKRKFSKKL
tara:strand:- start:2192 stop:2755 length:564 start_codon:yes stop_codon:yes gene_type:complete